MEGDEFEALFVVRGDDLADFGEGGFEGAEALPGELWRMGLVVDSDDS